MAKYNIYLGGDKRVRMENGESLWDSGLTVADQHVEYAAHLKTRHKTLQYYYDDGHKHTRMWYDHKGLQSLPVGDELGVILLASGSVVNNIVFHNKKAVAGTKLTVILNGMASDAPTMSDTLADKLVKAKEALARAQSEANVAPTDATKQKAVADARTKVAQAEKAIADANNTEVAKFDVDLSKTGFTILRTDKLLQTNGDITVKIKEGSLTGTCFTVSASVENHNDQHGCTCAQVACDTQYPQPLCG